MTLWIIDNRLQIGYIQSMEKTVRFGVSLDAKLLENFDQLIRGKGYPNRSEAIRDLIRDKLVSEEWNTGDQETVGVLALVYDHEARELTEKLNAIQHHHLHLVLSSIHVHLDEHHCLEVIILRGKSPLIREVSEKLIGTKNVKHGDLLMTTTGRSLR